MSTRAIQFNHNMAVFFTRLVNEVEMNGSEQDFSNSIANALKLLQSCTKPSRYWVSFVSSKSDLHAVHEWLSCMLRCTLQCGAVITHWILFKFLTRHPIAYLWGRDIVSLKSGPCSVIVTSLLHLIMSDIWLHNNSTRWSIVFFLE